MQILATALKQRLAEIEAVQERARMQHEVVQTIRVAGSICNQRSKAELVHELKTLLPPFFGFEAVGVMLLSLIHI